MPASQKSNPEFNDLLLVEAGRRLWLKRRAAAEPGTKTATLVAPEIAARFRSAPLSSAAKLYAAAASHADAGSLRHALIQSQHTLSWVALAFTLAGFCAGAITTQSLFATGENAVINIYWVLGGLVLLNLATLVLWAAGFALQPKSGGGLLGELVFWCWQHLALRKGEPAISQAVLESIATTYGGASQYRIARWSLSTLSHAVWCAYLSGAVLTMLVLLSIRQYGFVWETTILPQEFYLQLTQRLAVVPNWLGFNTPTPEEILLARAGNLNQLPPTQGLAWSGFLIGSVIIYGFLPRLLALLLSILMRSKSRAAFVLDLNLPEYAQALMQMSPLHGSPEVIDADDQVQSNTGPGIQPQTPLPEWRGGTRVLMGLEIDTPESGWPPGGTALFHDLGIVDGREELEQAMLELGRLDAQWLILVCSLLNTPDRGVIHQLRQIETGAKEVLLLVLTDNDLLLQRLSESQALQRIQDWHDAAAKAGLHSGWVRQIDLNRAGARTALEALVGSTA